MLLANESVPWAVRDDVIRGLVAGGLTFAASIIAVAFQWIRDREASIARIRRLDEAAKRVAFWEFAYKALTAIRSDLSVQDFIRRAEQEIYNACLDAESIFPRQGFEKSSDRSREVFLRHINALPGWRRWLLLYKPFSADGWIIRTLFYPSIGLFLCWFPIWTRGIFDLPPRTPSHIRFTIAWQYSFVTVFLLAIPVGVSLFGRKD